MRRTGTGKLPLHGGKAPKWLFGRMVKLAGVISTVFVEERGVDEYLRHICDPYWFQALSCVLGFDWHSSGTTTVTCHALKEVFSRKELGLKALGGKGGHSRKVPMEIEKTCRDYDLGALTAEELTDSSRLVAKIDNNGVQDGYGIYHHSFFLTEEGRWAVLQQGMNVENKYARRYHWRSDDLKDFLDDPHSSILSDSAEPGVLDLSSSASLSNRDTQLDLIKDGIGHLKRDVKRLSGLDIRRNLRRGQVTLDTFSPEGILSDMSSEYEIDVPDHIPRLDMPRRANWRALRQAYEVEPESYEEFMLFKGIGPRTVRAISLVSELIYGEKASWKDPVRYSFAVGGKDGVPYPVDRRTYDDTVEIYEEAISDSKLGEKAKLRSLENLRKYAPPGLGEE